MSVEFDATARVFSLFVYCVIEYSFVIAELETVWHDIINYLLRAVSFTRHGKHL